MRFLPLPPCPPDDQSPLFMGHPRHDISIIFFQTSIHMDEWYQLWSCCMHHVSWYWWRCLITSPNSTSTSASTFSSPLSQQSSALTPSASCSIPDISLGWAPMVGRGKQCMMWLCQLHHLVLFIAWWLFLNIFSWLPGVRAHTVQYEINLVIIKNYEHKVWTFSRDWTFMAHSSISTAYA